MQRRRIPRTALVILMAFIVLTVVGNALPHMVIASLTPIPVGEQYTYHFAPSQAYLIDAASYQKGSIPPANGTRKECTSTSARRAASTSRVPLSCFVIPVELRGERTTTTSQASREGTATITAITQLHAIPLSSSSQTSSAEKTTQQDSVDQVVMALDDTVMVARDSGYAVADPVSSTHLELPFLDVDIRKDNYVQEGLHYVFPFAPERISYPYWDVLAQHTALADYADPVTGPGGLTVWEYTQNLQAVPLDVPRQFRGTASQYFTLEELKNRHLEANSPVTLSPFYSVNRRLQVEPKTGIMTNSSVDVSIVLDIDQRTARSDARSGGTPEISRTLFRGSQTWDEATQQAALQRINPIVTQLKALQVLEYICLLLTVLLAAWALWWLLRGRHRSTATRQLSKEAPHQGTRATCRPHVPLDTHTNG